MLSPREAERIQIIRTERNRGRGERRTVEDRTANAAHLYQITVGAPPQDEEKGLRGLRLVVTFAKGSLEEGVFEPLSFETVELDSEAFASTLEGATPSGPTAWDGVVAAIWACLQDAGKAPTGEVLRRGRP